MDRCSMDLFQEKKSSNRHDAKRNPQHYPAAFVQLQTAFLYTILLCATFSIFCVRRHAWRSGSAGGTVIVRWEKQHSAVLALLQLDQVLRSAIRQIGQN